ncbi:hypothetical protein Tco_0342215, partial [Tanacetum coccineum]
GTEVIGGDMYEFQVTTGGATSETASKAKFDAGDAAARYCFVYSRYGSKLHSSNVYLLFLWS